MIKDLIRRQFLNGNTTKEDVYIEICEDRDWEDTDDLYELFKVEYDTVIESDWWERVQRGKRTAERIKWQIAQTDRKDYNLEKNKTARKYG